MAQALLPVRISLVQPPQSSTPDRSHKPTHLTCLTLPPAAIRLPALARRMHSRAASAPHETRRNPKTPEQVGAIRQGHFELSSGRHSGTYIQCALVLQFPQHAESLGRALAEIFRDHKFACVVSPALGDVIMDTKSLALSAFALSSSNATAPAKWPSAAASN